MMVELELVFTALFPLLAAALLRFLPFRGAIAFLAAAMPCAFAMTALATGWTIRTPAVTWLRLGGATVDVSWVLDPIAAAVVALGTGSVALVQLAAVDEADQGARAALRLAMCGSLNVLVLADSLFAVLLGWQALLVFAALLVGTASSRAGRKLFISARVGDFGMILALVVLFPELSLSADSVTLGMPSAAAVLLFSAVAWSTGQFPLWGWLQDAAVLPAANLAVLNATVPSAGVYLMLRLSPLFEQAPVLMWVGGITAVLVASMACAAGTLERVVAGTISAVVGIMLITGVSATALTVLVAALVAVLLGSRARVTPEVFLGTLALALLPGTLPAPSSFPAMVVTGCASALVAFSVWRALFLFFCEPAAPTSRLSPLLFALVASIGVAVTVRPALALACSLAGTLVAAILYRRRTSIEIPGRWLQDRLARQWHLDDFFEVTIAQPVDWLARVVVHRTLDRTVIDGTVGAVGRLGAGLGFIPQLFHSGNIQRYVAIFAIALGVLLAGWFLPLEGGG